MFVSRIFGSSLILRNRKPFLHYLNSERNLQFPKPVLARAQGPALFRLPAQFTAAAAFSLLFSVSSTRANALVAAALSHFASRCH